MRPNLQVLEPSLLGRIVDEAMTVLERTGVHIEDEHALKRLAKVGISADPETSRATFPLIRNREGKHLRASWDDAMGLIVDRFNEALAADGPDGVAIYNSGQLLLEEYYTLGKIARGGLGIANIDANTR